LASSPSRLRAAPADPTAAIAAPAASRRSYPLIGAGLLAALLGALLLTAVTAGSDHRRAILVVAHPVAVGSVLSPGDVATVKMSPGKGVGFMAAADAGKVVGRTAAVALVPGSLLLPAQLGSPAGLTDGQAAVGLLLEPGRYPPGLRSGDHVAVVSAPTGPVPTTGESLRLATGVVEDLAPTAGAGGVTTRVRLDSTASDRVAAEGAARRVALVLLPNETTK
jgi:hypothetical protein